jgi:hypothetical protein
MSLQNPCNGRTVQPEQGGSGMEELIPIILGIILGALIGRSTTGITRIVLSVAAVLVSGASATILSGEYVESWIYLLLDLGEAALGLALGFVIVHRLMLGLGTPKPRTASRKEGS